MVSVREWSGLQFRHIVRRNAWVYRKYLVNRLIWNLITPTITLLAFGLGVGKFIQGINGISYLTFIAPGLISFTACLAASGDTTYGSFIRMKFQNTFDAQLATPLSVGNIILGEILYATLASEFATCGMLLIAYLLNAPLSNMALATPFITFFGALSFASFGMVATSYAPKIESFTYFLDGFVIPVQFLSGAYFPIDVLPFPLKEVAIIIPLTAVVNVARQLFIGKLILNDFLWMVFLCLLTSISGMFIAKRKLKKILLT